MAVTGKMYQHARKRLLQTTAPKSLSNSHLNASQRSRLVAASRFSLCLAAGVAWGAGFEMYLWNKSAKENSQKTKEVFKHAEKVIEAYQEQLEDLKTKYKNKEKELEDFKDNALRTVNQPSQRDLNSPQPFPSDPRNSQESMEGLDRPTPFFQKMLWRTK